MRRLLFLLLLGLGASGAPEGPRIFLERKLPEFPWANRLEGLKETPPGLALYWRYTGDEGAAKKCLDELNRLDADEGYGLSAAGPALYLPITYDWLSDWKGFSMTEHEKIQEKIARTADLCKEFLEGRSDHVWHTSAPRAIMEIG